MKATGELNFINNSVDPRVKSYLCDDRDLESTRFTADEPIEEILVIDSPYKKLVSAIEKLLLEEPPNKIEDWIRKHLINSEIQTRNFYDKIKTDKRECDFYLVFSGGLFEGNFAYERNEYLKKPREALTNRQLAKETGLTSSDKICRKRKIK